MRVSISPSGSLIAISPSLPARLHEPGHHAPRPEIAKRDTAHPELAVDAAWPSGDLATQAHSSRAAIARQLGELDATLEALLGRLRLVLGHRLQRPALRLIALHEPHP